MSNTGQPLPSAHSEQPEKESSPLHQSEIPLKEGLKSSTSSLPSSPIPSPDESELQKEGTSYQNYNSYASKDEVQHAEIKESTNKAASPCTSFRTKEYSKVEESRNELLFRPPPFGREKIQLFRDFPHELACDKSHIQSHEMFEDEGGGDGPALVDSDEDVSPRYETVRDLLEDGEGAIIFKKFTKKEEKDEDDRKFWYACNGLKYQVEAERKDLIPVIFRKYIGNLRMQISDDVKKIISDRIHQEDWDAHIFDQAKLEVENRMTQTVFRRFLKSDEFARWLLQSKQESDPSSPSYVAQMSENISLPTLPEGREYIPSDKSSLLTTGNLLATERHRSTYEKYGTEFTDGNYGYNPYHIKYTSAVHVSLQPSELQSYSSGAHTDDTVSCNSGSFRDGMKDIGYSRKHLKRQQKLALQNPEPYQVACAINATMVIPRTMVAKQEYLHPEKNREEFANSLIDRLEQVAQKQKREEKVHESLQRIIHNEDSSNELRREYAENSLPPELLATKLTHAIPREDQNQQILDDHVARVFDSPDHTPGSPKPKSPPSKIIKGPKFHQFPHLALTQAPSCGYMPRYVSKDLTKTGKYPSIHSISQATSPAGGLPPMAGLPYGKSFHAGEDYYLPQAKMPYRSHAGRRRERGQNGFSTDSGNVSEYTSRHNANLPKSKSMPDYMENQRGTASDGGPSGSRPGSGSRRSTRHAPVEPQEDSGISVVSGSFPSLGSSSFGADRRNGGGGRRSQSSNSMSGSGCATNAIPCQNPACQTSYEHSRDSTGAIHSMSYERRKNRGSVNNKQPKQSGDTSGSTGSTLKKQQKLKQLEGSSNAAQHSLPPTAIAPPSASASLTEHVFVVYNYMDDEVPYTTKIPCRNVTLKKFKQQLPKKGNYRFFFKKVCEDIGVVMEEITDDGEVLPLYDGRIFAQIRIDD